MDIKEPSVACIIKKFDAGGNTWIHEQHFTCFLCLICLCVTSVASLSMVWKVGSGGAECGLEKDC